MLAAGQGTATLVFAAQWLVVCLLGTAISWALLMFFLRRRLSASQTAGVHQAAGVHRTPRQRVRGGPLFAALFVGAVGAANLYIEGHAFAMHAPLLAAPAQILFLLLFYLYPPTFPKASYAAHGIRWLGIIYAFAQVAAYIPQQPQQQQTTNPNVHLTPAQILAIPGVLGWLVVMGETFALAPIIIGLLPQLYTRARYLAQTGFQAPALSPARRALLAAAGLAASFALFVLAGLLAPPALLTPASTQAATDAAFSAVTASPPVLQATRLGFFLLTSLVPVGASFLLLSGRRYDREALAHRALIALALVACLLLVYAAGVIAVALVFPGFSELGYAYLPFILSLAVLLAAIYPPLRAWVEVEIGRRFFHETYEASQRLAAAGAALRTETKPDQLCAQLVSAVQKALRPSALALWVRPAPGAATFRASGVFAPATPPADVGSHSPETTGAAASDSSATPNPNGTHLRWYSQASGSGSATSSAADPSPAKEGAATLTVGNGDLARLAFKQPPSVVEVDRLPADSPVTDVLRAAHVRLALPLISQGELEGVLGLAPRAGAHRYGEDIRELLASLAGEVAPALRAARIAQRRDAQTRERERVEQELQTARRIQESLLPKELPALEGWRIATAYQPAREVGGDFYDFIALADGQLAIVLGDVTDHGIPAALVMATTRSTLRAVAAQPDITPDAVLAQVNELLTQDLPPSMFVTCFYALLDPSSGRLRYANAGQDLPYLRRPDGSVCELRATGMPLGMLPGSTYDTHETTLAPGDGLLFFSDGLVEAHSPAREMFGLGRVMRLLGERDGNTPPIAALLHALADFTGAYWEQEDDITLVALRRTAGDEGEASELKRDPPATAQTRHAGDSGDDGGGDSDNDEADGWRTLAAFELPSEPGGEREVIARVTAAVEPLNLPPQRLERLQTAVGEAAMNAMEHGNQYRPELPVATVVRASAAELVVRVTDHGSHPAIPPATTQTPDLTAKLAGEQSPRGWGLFLMRSLVDDVRVSGDATHHAVELVLALSEMR